MQGTIIGVLRGGPSREHEVSLKTGHAIAQNLDTSKYTVRDIYIDRNGQWFERGRAVSPAQALAAIDVAIIGLHGEYGEDGEIQKLLEAHGVPYTGSDPMGSFLAMHKMMAKQRAIELGIKTPKYRFVDSGDQAVAIAREVHHSFMHPVVVKPVRWGSSVGVTLAHGYAELLTAITNLLSDGSGGVLIEELIRGREATAGVVEDLRGEKLYALPTVEIVPPEKAKFFDYSVKYDGSTQEISPGRFSKEETEEMYRIARAMHEGLGLRHYSRSDFIVSPRGIYYLETNTLPGMTEQSLLPQSLAAIGVKFNDFLDHLVRLALARA
jgi:D-alanine-D-alanine ligase